MKQILPSYPLFIKDPFFSFWSATDTLNTSNVQNWHGSEKPIYGVIYTKQKSYSFLGMVENTEKLIQTNVEITSFSTNYDFTCEEFDLHLEFLSPLPLNDLTLLATPVCFLQYTITPKVENVSAKLALFMSEKVSYNYQDQKDVRVRGDVMKDEHYDIAYLGLDEQKVLSHSADIMGADWGYYYLTGEKCYFTSQDGLNSFIKQGEVEDLNKEQEKYIVSVNEKLSGKILVAFDDVCSIYYYGELLRGYYFKNGKTIIDAIHESDADFDGILLQCNSFDSELKQKTHDYGEKYFHILKAGLRQSIGGHKLVQDQRGRKLFLSKECGSDGCIATVDISYPSMPLYLLYNPELVMGMLYPIFDFAQMPVWTYDFAPHDAGVYPYCNGQFYGVKVQEKGAYHRDIGYLQFDRGVLPMYYLYTKQSDIYEFKRQMPVEECGNLLIMCALIIKAGGEKAAIQPYLLVLKKWADYLVAKGMIPENQLCTDDFAGYLDKNINLAIKATVALAAYDYILKAFDDSVNGKLYLEEATKRAKSLDHYPHHIPLTFDLGEETFSLKYNLLCDQLLETHLFGQKLIESEVEYYLSKVNDLGIPLDSRASYTKSDWLLWVAALTKNKAAQMAIIDSVYQYLLHTSVRVPFSDWYDTITGEAPLKHLIFRNRTVQGGLFAPLLKDAMITIADEKSTSKKENKNEKNSNFDYNLI